MVTRQKHPARHARWEHFRTKSTSLVARTVNPECILISKRMIIANSATLEKSACVVKQLAQNARLDFMLILTTPVVRHVHLDCTVIKLCKLRKLRAKSVHKERIHKQPVSQVTKIVTSVAQAKIIQKRVPQIAQHALSAILVSTGKIA